MDPLTISAASGLRSRMETIDMLANNLSNSTTAGFKLDREFYGVFSGEEQGEESVMPVIERPWTDFSQGLLQPTGNPLHAALSGKGFFGVNGPSGPLYTRNGAFSLSKDGTLQTGEGYTVRAAGGAAIRAAGTGEIEISRDGTVRESGQTLGQLEVMDFADPGKLVKQGGSYFRADGVKGVAPAANHEVHQGKLEASNVSGAEAAARMVGIMRQFEMLQKAITMAGEMNRKSVDEIAKVGS
ncbi:MAG: flagellar hook basal-body protein [Acidobacteria bacterium]|nr:flagellar hook basal-body protein [Acidobacteriota bacterium]